MSNISRLCRLWYTPRWIKWANATFVCVLLALHFADTWISLAWDSLSWRSWYVRIGTPELVQDSDLDYGTTVVPPIVPAAALSLPTLWLFIRDRRLRATDHQCQQCGEEIGRSRFCRRCRRIQILLGTSMILAGLALLPAHLFDRFVWLCPRNSYDMPVRVFVDGAPRHEGVRDPVCAWLPWTVQECVGETKDDAGDSIPWVLITAIGLPLWPLGIALVFPGGFLITIAPRRSL